MNASHNSVLVIAACVLLVFWLRDYMSLRMSPSRKAARRAFAYGAAILLTAGLVGTLAAKIGTEDFARTIQSRRVLFLLIAFHAAASIPSYWIKRTESYNWTWATALLPAPVVWLLLLITAQRGLGAGEPQLIFFAVAVAWAASMIVVVVRSRHIQMPLEDMDFAVLFGGLSHWLALCVLPLAFLMD